MSKANEPVRNEVTGERGFCEIISVGRAKRVSSAANNISERRCEQSERAGEERNDERAWILSDNIIGTTEASK